MAFIGILYRPWLDLPTNTHIYILLYYIHAMSWTIQRISSKEDVPLTGLIA
jgi:hypothetical protein